MTRKEAIRQTHQSDVLQSLGFTSAEAEALRRISLTLHRWSEHECNGVIERNEDDNNRPYWSNPNSGRHYVCRVADREAGALVRLQRIMDAHKPLSAYVQGDPRGCSLYIIRPGDVPEGANVDGYYSRGIAVY
jgi:hypothetical protein